MTSVSNSSLKLLTFQLSNDKEFETIKYTFGRSCIPGFKNPYGSFSKSHQHIIQNRSEIPKPVVLFLLA